MSLSAAQMRKIALAFPGVSEGISHGRPSFLLSKKFFTRLRREDNSLVAIVGSIDERDMLLEANPVLFHVTDHYTNYPALLVRMEKADAAVVRGLLERRWREIAPKRLIREYDAQTDPHRRRRSQRPGTLER